MKKPHEETFHAFLVALQIATADPQTHFELGVAYAEMDLLDDAILEFEEVLRAVPGHPHARAELMAARLRRGGPRARPAVLS